MVVGRGKGNNWRLMARVEDTQETAVVVATQSRSGLSNSYGSNYTLITAC
jgi:hypothetical protein